MAPRVRRHLIVRELPGKVKEWNGLVLGDACHVKAYGERGATWRFQYAVEREGKPTEVTVWGGAKGFASMRTFLEDRISTFSKKVVSTRRRESKATPMPPVGETLYDQEIRKAFNGPHPGDTA